MALIYIYIYVYLCTCVTILLSRKWFARMYDILEEYSRAIEGELLKCSFKIGLFVRENRVLQSWAMSILSFGCRGRRLTPSRGFRNRRRLSFLLARRRCVPRSRLLTLRPSLGPPSCAVFSTCSVCLLPKPPAPSTAVENHPSFSQSATGPPVRSVPSASVHFCVFDKVSTTGSSLRSLHEYWPWAALMSTCSREHSVVTQLRLSSAFSGVGTVELAAAAVNTFLLSLGRGEFAFSLSHTCDRGLGPLTSLSAHHGAGHVLDDLLSLWPTCVRSGFP